MFDNCHVDIVSNDRDRVTLITVKCDHVSCLLSVCSTEPSITDVRCWSSVCRYSVQLADISDKELTVSSSLQTSPLVMGLLLVDLFTIGLILGGGYKISRAEAGLHLAQTGGNLQQGGRCGGCTQNV